MAKDHEERSTAMRAGHPEPTVVQDDVALRTELERLIKLMIAGHKPV